MIDKSTVKKILDAADIVEVVSDYVHLTKRGSNYMGLCPFHNEKTPSFSVNRPRNICHCFSCGKGGSPVNFIMEKEGINYHDALLHLANKYGIKVEERELTDKEKEEQSERESMLIVNEWAMREMEKNLHENTEGINIGLQYLYHRGITEATIKKFRLGYALDQSQILYNVAINSGYDEKHLISVGLCGENSQGKKYDRFRGRVIFPIQNSAGKVVAFGGRGIKGEAAKYINSPESLIYRKSNELYGIYQAKNAIVRQDKCFLVEGYMDVVSMWQSGVENVVASSGTSLTDGQIALIHRFTQNVTLIYDGDSAGIKASLRGIDLLLTHNLNIKVLLLPEGEDPDSFAKKTSPEEFRKYIDDNETDFIRFKVRTLLQGTENDPIKRTEAINSIVKSLASISDNIKRSLYIQECSRLLNVAEKILIIEVKKIRGEVIAEQKKSRERSKLEINEPININKENSESESESDIDKSKYENSEIKVLRPLEREIIRYCVRYGMSDFCEIIDKERSWMIKVIEYVREELSSDGIEFTTPIYNKIFNRIIDIIPEYNYNLNELLSKINNTYELKLQEGYNDIALHQQSISEIEKAEILLKTKLENEKNEEILNFSLLYVGNQLGSDIDDDIRKEVLSMITDRYQLSKYHSKTTKIEKEIDRLPILLPRAIAELKDGILSLNYKRLTKELSNAISNKNDELIEEIMINMQNINQLRKDFAKNIGERIVSPK